MAGSEQDNCAQNCPTLEQKINRLAELNDQCRACRANHILTITAGVQGLGTQAVLEIIEKVRTFDTFTPENDPYGEHDFGSFHQGSDAIFWKIDYYDKQLEFGSADPTDMAITVRVITVMLASEY